MPVSVRVGICLRFSQRCIYVSVVATTLPFSVTRVRACLVCLLACESVPVSAYVHERVYVRERGSVITFEHTREHACSNTIVR
jgi:hypothetical protein